MSQITIDVPDAAITAGDPSDLAAEVRMAAAVRCYMTGRLRLHQAALMVGLSTIEFRQRMGEYGGTEFTQTREELERELLGA